MAPPVPDSLARRGDFRPCEPDALQGCYPQLPAMNRITQWCNRRILELRMKLDQLRQFKPTKPNRARMQEHQLAKAEAELDHWLYFVGEDE